MQLTIRMLTQRVAICLLLSSLSVMHHEALATLDLATEHAACSALHRFSHRFTLDETTLEQALVLRGLETSSDESGTGISFSMFLQRVLAHPAGARPLNVVVLGGSFTVGWGLQPPTTNYLWRLVDVLRSLNPKAIINGLNSAHGSSRPSLGLLCADALLPANQGVDLVLLEWNPNLGSHPEIMGTGIHHRVYERLIRRLLRWRGSPAVVVINLNHPKGGNMHFYNGTEDAYLVAGQYYSLATISMRNALFIKQWFSVSGFGNEMRTADHYHYNKVGHTYVGDALAYLVRSTLAQQCIRAKLPALLMVNSNTAKQQLASAIQHPALQAVSATQPPVQLKIPMLEPPESDVATDKYKMCVLDEQIQAYVGAHEDWAYTADQKHGYKYGYVSTKKGSWMQLQVPRPVPYAGEPLVFYLSTLISDIEMGCAEVTCSLGCTCLPTQINSTWTTHVSVYSLTPIELVTFDKDFCTVSITHLGGVTSAARFEVTGFMVTARDDLMNAKEHAAFGTYGGDDKKHNVKIGRANSTTQPH